MSALGVVVVVLFNVLRLAHLFSGSASQQPPSTLLGRVVFGSDYSYTNGVYKVVGPKSRFDTNDTSLAWVAYFSQPAGADTVTRSFESVPPTEEFIQNINVSLESPGTDTVAAVWNADQLRVTDLLHRPGTYKVTYTRNDTVLATGEFDVGNVSHHVEPVVLPTSTPAPPLVEVGPGNVVAGTGIGRDLYSVANGGQPLSARGSIVWIAQYAHPTVGTAHVIMHVIRRFAGRIYRFTDDVGQLVPGTRYLTYDPSPGVPGATELHHPGRYTVTLTQGKSLLARGHFTVTQ